MSTQQQTDKLTLYNYVIVFMFFGSAKKRISFYIFTAVYNFKVYYYNVCVAFHHNLCYHNIVVVKEVCLCLCEISSIGKLLHTRS